MSWQGVDQARVREQSAQLAAMLAQPGATGTQGGEAPRPPTVMERQLLAALAAAPGRAWGPAELIERHPDVFGDRSAQGLHQSAKSLVRKGLIRRRKRRVHEDGRHYDRRAYQVTEAGLAALQ